MSSKPRHLLTLVGRLGLLLLLFALAGCGGGDSKETPAQGGSTPTLSLPLPKGMWAPSPDSDLTLAARAVIDPGAAGARTVDLSVDLTANRVTGVIDGVPAGSHTVEIQYFMNQIQIATVTFNANIIAGKNNTVDIAPALIHYVEAVSDALFVAKSDDQSIAIFDHDSTLPGGVVAAAPTRTLKGADTGIAGPAAGGLFVDSVTGGLYLTNLQANSVAVWNHAATVDGNTPPDRVVAGAATRLNQPTGIALDPFRNRLYVVNQGGEILIWNEAASLAGEVAPSAVVAGALTGLIAGNHPLSLDVRRDALYVANGTEVRVFEKLSRLTGDQDVGPTRTIQIAGLSQAGLALDSLRDFLYVSSQDANGTIYQLTGASTASGAVAPAVTLAGAETGLNQAAALAFGGDVLMALNQGGSEVRVWHQADQKTGAASPTQILEWSPPAAPAALFYVATQNGARDQAQQTLEVQKAGSGHGSVTSDLPGIACGTTCSALFAVGEKVTLTAAPEDDSIFAGWSGACSGTDSCVVTIDAAKTVTATFNDTQAPTVPTGLTATAAGASQISLSWTAPADNIGVVGYWIERCQGPSCSDFSQIATSAGTAYNDTGLLPTTSYRYRVRATDAAGNLSGYSSIATATTAAHPVLQVKKSGTGRGTVTSSQGVNSAISCGATCSASFASGTSVTLTATADPGSTLASFSGGCASTTSPCTFTITADTSVTVTFNDTQAPKPPTLTANPVSATQVNLSWTVSTDNIGVTGYRVDRCQGGNCSSFAQITTTTGTTYNNTGLTPGTTYKYRVRALDAGGNGSNSNTVIAVGLTVTKVGTGTGTVTSSPAGINCGTICSFSFVSGTPITLTAAANSGSSVAGFSGGCTSTTTTCAFTITTNTTAVAVTFNDTQAPIISNVASGAVTSSGATITWATDEASDSQVEYGPTTAYGSSTTLNAALVTNHSATLSNLSSATLYHYRVKSKDAAGNPATSGDFTFTTADVTSPSAPSNLTAAAVSGSQINLSWAASTDNVGVTGYLVERCQGAGCSNFAQIAAPTNGTTYIDTGLLSATSYSYQVRATDAAGNLSPYSNMTTATTFDTIPPTAPSGLAAKAAGSSQIDLTWAASTDNVGVSGYWIERCQGLGCTNFAPVNTASVAGTSYSDTGLTSGTVYNYQIRATDVAGNLSAYSNTASATTLQTFTLTVVIDAAVGAGGHVTGPGIDCGADCSEIYTINTSVTLNAVPDSLSQSSGWTGCDSTTAPTPTAPATCTVNINSDKEVHAAFSLLPVTP